MLRLKSDVYCFFYRRRGDKEPRDLNENNATAVITELLNSLLEGYDKHLRPGFGGEWGHLLIK